MNFHAKNFFERVAAAKQRIRQVSADEAILLAGSGAIVLDVRDEDEFGRGHIDGAMHIDTESLEQNIHRLVPDEATRIVCYCSSGYRATLVTDELQKLGYRNVMSIDGGLRAYLRVTDKKAVA